jgi:3-deoxy-manno-octulosonate cytidylyltransferase (CMP-KDO synthetase)
MKILGLIPARYASTRLPAKALKDLAGKTMIQRVYEQAAKAKCLSKVVVATDDKRIFDHVKSFGGNVSMTREDHVSGTDRCFEALTIEKEKFDYVINIQGDEPFIKPGQIDLLGSKLNGSVEIATLGKAISSVEELESDGEVKITMNVNKEALYFSRAIIPFIVSNTSDKKEWLKKYPFFKHVGMYAYRSDVLAKITTLPLSSLEAVEKLEQLRWLENGFKVSIVETDEETMCIDTQQDYEKALAFLKRINSF